MRVNTEIILNETDVSSSTISSIIALDHIYGFSSVIEWTGSASTMSTAGELQVSNDNQSWVTYHYFVLEGDTADKYVINVSEVFYKMARFKLTVASDEISPKITVYKKGI